MATGFRMSILGQIDGRTQSAVVILPDNGRGHVQNRLDQISEKEKLELLDRLDQEIAKAKALPSLAPDATDSGALE